MIVTKQLTKYYADVRALENLNLEVKRGEVFGLLGPNGSGKTTSIRLILGLLRPSSGAASVQGRDCWRESVAVRELISYLPGELRLPGYMTGYGLLRFLGELREGDSLERAMVIAEKILKLDLTRKVRTFSTGMKQKLAIAQTFSDPVEILILDEPTSALDPSAREIVLDLVRAARSEGKTVIFSGHVLSEVEAVADRVAIMRKGRLMHVEDMHKRRKDLRLILLRFKGEAPPIEADGMDLSIRERRGDVVLIEHRGDAQELVAWLSQHDIQDLAIGTDDLKHLYDLFHGPDAAAKFGE